MKFNAKNNLLKMFALFLIKLSTCNINEYINKVNLEIWIYMDGIMVYIDTAHTVPGFCIYMCSM